MTEEIDKIHNVFNIKYGTESSEIINKLRVSLFLFKIIKQQNVRNTDAKVVKQKVLQMVTG